MARRPNNCHVCEHSQRAQVELGLARKVPLRALAKRFEPLSIHSLCRHRQNHMPPQLVAALNYSLAPSEIDLEKLKESESEGLIQQLVAQRGRLWHLVDEAEKFGDLNGAARAHGQLNANLTLTARLLGELATHSQITLNNLIISPSYLQLRHGLLDVLRDHPEVSHKVAAVLRELEAPVEETPMIDITPERVNGHAGP